MCRILTQAASSHQPRTAFFITPHSTRPPSTRLRSPHVGHHEHHGTCCHKVWGIRWYSLWYSVEVCHWRYVSQASSGHRPDVMEIGHQTMSHGDWASNNEIDNEIYALVAIAWCYVKCIIECGRMCSAEQLGIGRD